MTPIRVIIADGRADRREALGAALARSGGFEVLGQVGDGPQVLARAPALGADLILLADDLPPGGGFEAVERLAGAGAVVLLSDDVRPEALRRAMRAGARELLAWTLPPGEVAAALRAVHADGLRRASTTPAAPGPGRGPARVIAVAGAKGGVGRTTLAVNLAAALARDSAGPTALLDLHTQFGGTSLLLGLTPRRTLADLARIDPEGLDGPLLEDHLERHACGLAVLAGAGAPAALDALSPAGLDRLLLLAGREFRHVILDVPAALHATSLAALARADDVLLVCDLSDLTALAASRLWLDALAGPHVRPETLRVVLNRVPARGGLEAADAERTLGLPLDALVPDGGRLVPDAANAGVPFVLSHPNSAPARAVCALARALCPDAAPLAAPARRRTSFFGARLHREGGR